MNCLAIGCASIAPPGGGPEDKTRPTVVSSFPDSGAVMVDAKTEIIFTFSEPILPSTLTEALFFSPPSIEYKKIRWRKNLAIIILEKSIPLDQTIVVTVGTIIQDLHRNNLAESFTLAFSTGETVANGQISGTIMGERNLNGMIVGAWILDSDSMIDPTGSMAPYATQVGENNNFKLNYLSSGIYRVIAWSDRDRDRLYDPRLDIIGLPSNDVKLGENGKTRINFFASELDTGKAIPLIVSSTDQNHVSVRFNGVPRVDLFRLHRYAEISDSLEILNITHGWFDPEDSTRLYLRTSEQMPGVNYTLTFSLDALLFGFKGSVHPDTTAPVVAAFSPRAGARNISTKPSGWMAFQDAITTTGKEELLSLTIDDTVDVPIEFQVNMANQLIWKTLDPLPEGSNCNLRLMYSEIIDMNGNHGLDTVWTMKFSILERATLGEISGKVSGGGGGSIRVMAEPLTGRGDSFQADADAEGDYILRNLPPGSYNLWAYEDRNLNSIYDPGSLIPFRFSERIALLSDTLVVRARWETADIRINFP